MSSVTTRTVTGSISNTKPLLAGLFKWAEERAQGRPRVISSLKELAAAYEGLLEACAHEDEDERQLIHEFAALLGARGKAGRIPNYDLDAKLRALAPGKVITGLRALADEGGADPEARFNTLRRRRMALLAEDRLREKERAARERSTSAIFGSARKT